MYKKCSYIHVFPVWNNIIVLFKFLNVFCLNLQKKFFSKSFLKCKWNQYGTCAKNIHVGQVFFYWWKSPYLFTENPETFVYLIKVAFQFNGLFLHLNSSILFTFFWGSKPTTKALKYKVSSYAPS